MFTVTKPKPNRINIDLNGGIDANIMTAGLEELFRLSQDVKHGRILYTIADFEMPTLGAIGAEILELPKMFKLLGKYERCAVLSDHGWIRSAAELEGALIPHLEIKSFHLDEARAAEAWLDV
ncbi:MAG: STAS/SEC14 domain-containing protein [Planktotalea sp.]|uniref:STAS/SEC14 domain-containing protein n=1 Tax=Planktotalea sp. TaxID=2029877 RepID=UPI003C767775